MKKELRRFHSQRTSLNKKVKCKMKLIILMTLFSNKVNFSKNVFSESFLLRKKKRLLKQLK